MATFYICRHGETENNRAGRLSGWIDTPLTDLGIQNALTSASKLNGIRLDMVCSSDLGRAFTTAYIIAKELSIDIDIKRFKEFREVNYGELANKTFDAFPALSFEEVALFTPPGGESLIQMQRRTLKRINDLADENPNSTILIVGHDGTINSVRAAYLNQNIGEADATHNPHDFVAKFEVVDGKITASTKLN